jgi:uncharacterized hydrophobic protein (TIGR00271 family)
MSAEGDLMGQAETTTDTAALEAAGDAAVEATLVDARQSLGPAKLDDLFPGDAAFRASLLTFSVLLVLAGFIASFGLYQDSVASIIGAMVVAPLGGAIMAFAGALVTARTRWMWITFLQVVIGAAAVVAIGFLVSLVMPQLLVLTPSLKARTSPGLLDLGVALAAGAAGAYVAARRTGSDALPGVAIAVSLVPPLATVGICLELGRPSDAAGALLLFTTNFAAITVAACIVFVLSGAAPSRELLRERHQVRNGFIVAVFALVIISIPLISNAVQRAKEYIRSTTGAPYVLAWIGDRDLVVREWAVNGDTVSLVLAGPDAPGDPATLATSLATAFGGPVYLDLEYVPSAHLKVEAAP